MTLTPEQVTILENIAKGIGFSITVEMGGPNPFAPLMAAGYITQDAWSEEVIARGVSRTAPPIRITDAGRKALAVIPWKLRTVSTNSYTLKLTPAELAHFTWALDGAKDAVEDPAWVEDNEDALTVEGQLDDMRYRLTVQAEDMIAEIEDKAERKASRYALSGLVVKLERAGYFNRSYHV